MTLQHHNISAEITTLLETDIYQEQLLEASETKIF